MDRSSSPEDFPPPNTKTSSAPSSLDLLCPRSTTTNTHAPPKTQTALFLEDLHAHIVDILNNRDWSHPDLTTYLHPDFAAYLEYTDKPYVTSRDAFLERHKALAEESPGYRFALADVNASVDENKEAALLWFRLRIWGQPEGVEREGVYVSMYKKTKGVWVCYRQNGLRGMKV